MIAKPQKQRKAWERPLNCRVCGRFISWDGRLINDCQNCGANNCPCPSGAAPAPQLRSQNILSSVAPTLRTMIDSLASKSKTEWALSIWCNLRGS